MRWITPFGQLVIVVAMLAAFQTTYVVAGVTPSANAEMVLAYTFPLYTAFWVVADAEQRRRVPCYDFGLLVATFFPVSLLWYLFWSRGWKGLKLLAVLFALAIAPSVCATVVELVLNGVA